MIVLKTLIDTILTVFTFLAGLKTFMAVAVSLSRTLRCMHLSARRCVHTPSASHIFDLKSNLLEFDEQTVMAGTESLDDLSKHLQSLNKSNPLIVSDNGIKATGSLDMV